MLENANLRILQEKKILRNVVNWLNWLEKRKNVRYFLFYCIQSKLDSVNIKHDFFYLH